MKRIFRTFITGLLPILCLAIGGLVSCRKPEPEPETVSAQLASWGMRVRLPEELRISSRNTEKVHTFRLTELVSHGETSFGRVSRLEGIDSKAAEHYIRDKSSQLLALYDPKLEGYFATFTHRSECPEKYRPSTREKHHPSNRTSVLSLYANERRVIGACIEDNIRYRALVAFAYCEKSRTVYHLELFVPVSKAKDADADALLDMTCS